MQRVQNAHHRMGSSPIILFLLGALMGIITLAATIVQIQTSELLAMGNLQNVTGVSWAVLMQPWELITGTAPVGSATAWIYGWAVEVITLVFAVALSKATASISASNPHLGRWFVIGSIVLIALNSYADYSASPGNTPLIKFLIALAIALVVVCGIPITFGLFEHGAREI
jgi:hypothetical protein